MLLALRLQQGHGNFDMLAGGALQASDADPGVGILVNLVIHRAFLLARVAMIAPFRNLKLQDADPVEEGKEQAHGTDASTKGAFGKREKNQKSDKNEHLQGKQVAHRFNRWMAGFRIYGVPGDPWNPRHQGSQRA